MLKQTTKNVFEELRITQASSEKKNVSTVALLLMTTHTYIAGKVDVWAITRVLFENGFIWKPHKHVMNVKNAKNVTSVSVKDYFWWLVVCDYYYVISILNCVYHFNRLILHDFIYFVFIVCNEKKTRPCPNLIWL